MQLVKDLFMKGLFITGLGKYKVQFCIQQKHTDIEKQQQRITKKEKLKLACLCTNTDKEKKKDEVKMHAINFTHTRSSYICSCVCV